MRLEKGGGRLLLGATLFAAVAGCHSGVPTAKVSALVNAVTHGQASVREIFDGPPGSGLTGAVIAGGSHPPVVVWITADGKTLIAGDVVDARGRNLTVLAAGRFAGLGLPAKARFDGGSSYSPPAPVPAASFPSETGPGELAPEAVRTMMRGVRFLRQGPGTRTLWIFLDPDCIWCHRLSLDLKAHPLPADVAVNWVPVAFLRPSSVGRAETLLAGGLPALDKDETGFDETTEEGGVPETHTPELEAAVRENTRILLALGGTMTPTVVFRDGKGRTLRFDGFPTPEILSRIAGEAR